MSHVPACHPDRRYNGVLQPYTPTGGVVDDQFEHVTEGHRIIVAELLK